MSALVSVTSTVSSPKPQDPTSERPLIGHAKSVDRYVYLLNYPSVERWLRRKAPLTRYEYLRRYHNLQPRLQELTGSRTPDEFVSWAKTRDGTDVQDVIEALADTEKGSSRTVTMMALRSLLRKHGYNSLPKVEEATNTPLEYHPGYKRDEVQRLLEYLDQPIEKLYVHFAKDSGLRSQDILSLCYRHVKRDLEGGKEYVHLELEPIYYNRKKSAGITFIGPNTVQLLKQLVNNGTVRAEPNARIFAFKYETLRQVLVRAKKKADLDRKIQPSHGLRKFFENCLDRIGLDLDKKRQLEGHSLGVRWAYTDQGIDPLRELYKQAYRFLDLSEESVVSNELHVLQSKIDEQEKTITNLKNERAEWAEALKFTKELMAHPEIKKLLGDKEKKG